MSVQADFCAILVDEWARAGVTSAVVAPGSRSAPLTLALLGDARIEVVMRLDERSAGFFALGAALRSRCPVVVLTTSGTATAELHAAVMEADRSGVPLVVCTADRPFELHEVGAPQTVEQVGLFGGAVRFSIAPGVAEAVPRSSWRSLASRLVAEATSGTRGPGPVHANLAFREPLASAAGDLPPGRADGAPFHELVHAPAAAPLAVERLVELLGEVERGLIVAGSRAVNDDEGRDAIYRLAAGLGWPVLTDGRAWPLEPAGDATVLVAGGDQIVRDERVAELLMPELVLCLGAIPASKALGTFARAAAERGARRVQIDVHGRFEDPDRLASVFVHGEPGALAAVLSQRLEARATSPGTRTFAEEWAIADRAAQQAIDEVLARHRDLSEPWLARNLFDVLPPGATLVASSSMPVRELEWFSRPRASAPVVLANRGASGIDGIVSTVLGASFASRGGPTVGLLGDLAFLHDLSALVRGSAERPLSATLVVVDNGGGGIFSFLDYAGELDPALFERAFATPQANAVERAAAGLGCAVRVLERREDFEDALASSIDEPGISVIVAKTERRANLAVHRELATAVGQAVREALRR